jgi:imidazolonepropionase
MPSFDTIYVGFHAATMVSTKDYGPIENAAIGVKHGQITWLGPVSELPNHTATIIDLGGGWVTPGLVDCHTHLVFGGDRSAEYEMRLQGASYQAIAKAGGGIVSTVTDTRNASAEALFTAAEKRLCALMADGVTCVEVKSGYGLDLVTEEKMLRVARSLGEKLSVTLQTTCLAAHAIPPEFQGQADAYIDLVCEEIIPAIAKAGLADAVDGFCEGIAFSVAQIERVFDTALAFDLPVKLHAEQLSNLGGSGLAARYKALSSDHLEYLSDADAKAMAIAGTVAVILPGAFFCLKETKQPPIQRLRELGVPMAIASDCNPGSAPVLSLRLMMNMACTLFGFTPLEALQGATRHGAQALGLGHSHGQLKVGYAADFVCWEIQKPAELSYWLGGQLVKHRVVAGQIT